MSAGRDRAPIARTASASVAARPDQLLRDQAQLLGTTAAGTATAAWTGLLDRRTGRWDPELLAAAGRPRAATYGPDGPDGFGELLRAERSQLLGGQGDAGEVGAEFMHRRFRQRPPAATDFEHAVPGLHLGHAQRAVHLGLLGAGQVLSVVAVEPGAGAADEIGRAHV